MSRHEAIGEVRFIGGIWTTRVRVLGRRESFDLPTCKTRDDAGDRSRLLVTWPKGFRQAQGNRARAPAAFRLTGAARAPRESMKAAADAAAEPLDGKIPVPEKETAPTFAKVGTMWTSGDLARDYPDHVRLKDYTDDEARLEF